MDAAGYTIIARQSGLSRELQVVANNIANTATTGFRREGVVFSEYISRLPEDRSLSMAYASGRNIDLSQGELSPTGGQFDFAIEGDGFFLLETPRGNRMTRAGHFSASAEGELVNSEGYRLLDAGGAPIQLPAGGMDIALAADGTLSANGEPIAQVGLWLPIESTDLQHEAGTLFFTTQGEEPAEEPGKLFQGKLESGNVNPIAEISRMIEVQRTYELGQAFLEREDNRIRSLIQTLK